VDYPSVPFKKDHSVLALSNEHGLAIQVTQYLPPRSNQGLSIDDVKTAEYPRFVVIGSDDVHTLIVLKIPRFWIYGDNHGRALGQFPQAFH